MTIEIHSAELEGLLVGRLAAGKFANFEDLLLQTFKENMASGSVADEDERLSRARQAADGIMRLRKGVSLERPQGMSLREYAHFGHKY